MKKQRRGLDRHNVLQCNSVATLRKTKIYKINVDLVNDNVYSKVGLNLFIRSQDIEQKPNSDVNQGP